MKNMKFVLIVFTILNGLQMTFAQSANEPTARPTPPPPVAKPMSAISETIARNLAQLNDKTPVSRERREEAYGKLLEGQRYYLSLRKQRAPAAQANVLRLAKQSLQKAIELNPQLAEAYTALAEISNTEEAILLANIAVKIEPENFGGHRILARLYTFKSNLNIGVLEPEFTQKAISEWHQVARLDPRNAEAFAFLSEFYARTKKPVEQLDALRKWQSSVAPLEAYFYRRVMGERANLSPESATVKYGEALLESGKMREAIEVISRAVTDNPENEEAIELLRQAVESADGTSAAMAVQSLQQAVFANPENVTLIEILAQMHARTGKIDEAAKVLREATAKLSVKNAAAAATLQIFLGDVYVRANRFDEAINVYQSALTLRGISETTTDENRDFAIRVLERMIEAYKKANRPNDAKAVIDRARVVLGKADLFADKKLISFYLETGKKPEALQAVRALRARQTGDYALLRLEAEILTDTGKVDEAVELIKTALIKKPMTSRQGNGIGSVEPALPSPMTDEFLNYIFISTLYTKAKRNKEAIEAVNRAYTVTQSTKRKEIARLTLATVQQSAGDFRGAEETLREILKQSPRNPIALNNLGYFLTERDEKFDEAIKLIEQALEIDPLNPFYLDSLGWVYFKLGKLSEAEKYLKEALQIDDTSSTIHEHLGDVYQKQGKLDLAKTAWQKALSLTEEAEEISRIKTKLAKGVSK